MAGGGRTHEDRIVRLEHEVQFTSEQLGRTLDKTIALESQMSALNQSVQEISDQVQELKNFGPELLDLRAGMRSILSQLNSLHVQGERLDENRRDPGSSSSKQGNDKYHNQRGGDDRYGSGFGRGGEERSNLTRHARFDFPVFSSGDPNPWILRAELYFEMFESPEDTKVRIASYHLDGEAIQWYHWYKQDSWI